jgi:hypothetical protein
VKGDRRVFERAIVAVVRQARETDALVDEAPTRSAARRRP